MIKKENRQISSTLEKIRRLAEKPSKQVKQMTPHLLIRSDKNPELLSFLHEYENMLMRNHVLTEDEYVKVSCLELTYPSSSEPEGKFVLFFDSPGEVANTNARNQYTGVFVINMDNYIEENSCKDEHIRQLMQFAKEKQKTIRFVFLLPAEANSFYELDILLQECLTIEQVDIKLPTQMEVEEYLIGVLAEQSIYISSKGYEDIRTFSIKVMESKGYKGFETLEAISNKIVFTYFAEGYDEKIIDDMSIQEMLNKVCISEKSTAKQGMKIIGFC